MATTTGNGEGTKAPGRTGRLWSVVGVALGLTLGALAGIVVGLLVGVGIAVLLGLL